MDRPKQRQLIAFSLALIALAAVFLINRQWPPTSYPPSPSIAISTAPAVEPQPLTRQSTVKDAIAPTATAPISNTARFGGQVIDAATRKPVKSFEVKLIRTHGGAQEEPIVRQFSSVHGRFSWNVEPGTWRISVTARGYQDFLIKKAEISDDTVANEIVMPLLRGFGVRGRVVDSSSRAGIADATITFMKRDEVNEKHIVFESDKDGEFSLDGVPSGEVILSISASKRAPRQVMIFVDENTPEQEIVLSSGATISGVVMTTAGGPAKGRVHIYGLALSSLRETTEAGEFHFEHLPAGRYKVAADTPAGGNSVGLHLESDEIKEGVVLVVGAGRSIRGVVKGLKSEQLQNVALALHTDATSSFFNTMPDDGGTYSFNGVPPGPGMMTVHGETFTWQRRVDMPVDDDLTIDVVIPTGSRLSGHITEGGKVASHKLVLLRPVDRGMEIFYQAQTDNDGSYKIENLASGEYLLRAEGDISRPISIAGDATLNVDIRSTQLSARVVEDGGVVPIVGATVYLRGVSPETSRVRGDMPTDDFGQFELTGIEPGDVVLTVYKPGFEMHRETISYSTPITDKTIKLRKDKGVEVRIAPGSRRFPRGFTLTQRFPHSEYIVDLWMPINSERVCYIPGALTGTTFEIGRFSGKPIVFEDWDGLPFELP